MIDRSKCEGCHLQDQEPVDTRTSGDDPGYMVVTEAPAAYNAQRGRLLSNNASKVLSRELASLGFDKDDFLFVPQIRCVFDPDTLPSKTKALIQKQCRAHLLDTIKEHRPDVIIPLGAEPSKQVHGRAVKITKVRGQAEYSVEHDAVVIPMLHPGYVAMYPQHYSVFKADCNTFARVVDNDLDIEAASNINAEDYHIITDLQFLIDMEPSLIFFDTETTGLEFFHKGPDNVRDYDPDIHGREFDPSAAILTMQFCVKSGTAYMLVWDHPEKPISLRNKAKIKKQLVQLFGRKKTRIIGQNSKFDANFVFETLGIRYEIGGDTLMLAALLDENMISKGQDVLVKHYVAEKAGYADTFNATYDKSRMWEVPLDAMIRYGCGDVDTGFMLYKVLIKKLLEDPLLTAQYRYVSLPGINTFADIEVNGIEVDDDALQAFQAIMEESVADQYQSLIAQVPRSIRKKHIDKGLAFSRPAFLLDILFEHRDGFRLRPKVFTKSTEKLQSDMRVPSVSTKDHLPYFFEECPFTEELATYIKDERLLTTSVKGFNKKYIHDGLVRPTYALWVTVTGRSSSENPNGQNFPKRGLNAKAYRRIFIAPRGWVVIEADLSQAELRIAADMANEQTMLRIYREGGDIHKSTALIVMGVSLEEFLALPKEEQKAARQKAKAVNFGFIYGMGWRKFIGYAKTQYGVEFSEQEAQRIREAFFSLYSGLTRWHEAMRAWAREHGYVRSYSGRIRHLPMIYSDDEGVQQEAGRQAINSPVQNFASDLGVIAISRMRKAIDPAYLKPIAFVHDAIYCYAREEYAMWGAETIKYYMESNPLEVMFNRRMKVPIVADVSVGRNFGDTYELEGFTSADEFDVGTLWNEDEKSGILLPKQIAPYKNGARQQHIYCTAD